MPDSIELVGTFAHQEHSPNPRKRESNDAQLLNLRGASVKDVLETEYAIHPLPRSSRRNCDLVNTDSLPLDCVLIGQGLAGTTLGWHLYWRGMRCLIIDREEPTTSSKIAGGLMTPVTGQRLVPTWRLNEIWPAAIEFHARVEAETQTRLFHQRGHVRLFQSQIEQDRFALRNLTDLPVKVRQAEPLVDQSTFHNRLGGFEMPEAGQLDVAAYLKASRSVFEQADMYRVADVDLLSGVKLVPDGVELPDLGLRARRLIFCQGFAAGTNPWLHGIEFDPTRGEILTIRVPGLHETRIVNCGVWLAPIGDERFRVGSTYDWEDLEAGPTQAGRDELCTRLREFLRLPFEVIDHSAAVRPIVTGRHPIIGMHPRIPQIGVFNGLGSKGSLQAPFFAGQLADLLTSGKSLDDCVDVQQRFTLASNPLVTSNRKAQPRLTELAHAVVRKAVCPGDAVIDATAGNGHDTCFLAGLTGANGVVIAFDVQADAVQRTRERLKQNGLHGVTTLQQNHAELKSAVPESLHRQVSAVMFNLGYLPGGDKSVVTLPQTTVRGIGAALGVLRPGGVVTIVVYPGHAGGAAETTCVEQLLESLDGNDFSTETIESMPATESSPRLHIVKRRGQRDS